MFNFDVPCHTAEEHDAAALELIEFASDPRIVFLFGTRVTDYARATAAGHVHKADMMRRVNA